MKRVDPSAQRPASYPGPISDVYDNFLVVRCSSLEVVDRLAPSRSVSESVELSASQPPGRSVLLSFVRPIAPSAVVPSSIHSAVILQRKKREGKGNRASFRLCRSVSHQFTGWSFGANKQNVYGHRYAIYCFTITPHFDGYCTLFS